MKTIVKFVLIFLVVYAAASPAVASNQHTLYLPIIYKHPHKLVVRDTQMVWLDSGNVFVEHGAFSPEDMLDITWYSDYGGLFSYIASKGYNSIYMIVDGYDNHNLFVDELDKYTMQWSLPQRARTVRLANQHGLHVNVLLHEQETTNDIYWQRLYTAFIPLLTDASVTWVVSEEWNHSLTTEEMIERAIYIRQLDPISPIGVHNTGQSLHGLMVANNDHIDTFLVQWYASDDMIYPLIYLQEHTRKYIVMAEVKALEDWPSHDAWCSYVSQVHAKGAGVGFYVRGHDQFWRWYDLPNLIPVCD